MQIMRQNSKKQMRFHCSGVNKDTIRQPHQVENEFPPTQNFSIKTLIGPHCEVGVHGESGHHMKCLPPVPRPRLIMSSLHAAVGARSSKHATIIVPDLLDLRVQQPAEVTTVGTSFGTLSISCVASPSSDKLNCIRRG